MPIKCRLARSEQLDHLARAKQMRAAGVDVQIRDEWWEAARPLNVTIIPFHSHVYDLRRGGAAYAVWVRLVARWRTTVTSCQLLTERDHGIELVEFDDDRPSCSLEPQVFPLHRVLNPRLMSPLNFHGRDHMVEGVILFAGPQLSPELLHGMALRCTLTFFDPNENEICKAGQLFVDRTGKPRSQPLSRRSGLYDDDEIFVTSRPLFPQRVPDEFPVNRVGQKEIKSEPTRTDEGEKDRGESTSEEEESGAAATNPSGTEVHGS